MGWKGWQAQTVQGCAVMVKSSGFKCKGFLKQRYEMMHFCVRNIILITMWYIYWKGKEWEDGDQFRTFEIKQAGVDCIATQGHSSGSYGAKGWISD